MEYLTSNLAALAAYNKPLAKRIAAICAVNSHESWGVEYFATPDLPQIPAQLADIYFCLGFGGGFEYVECLPRFHDALLIFVEESEDNFAAAMRNIDLRALFNRPHTYFFIDVPPAEIMPKVYTIAEDSEAQLFCVVNHGRAQKGNENYYAQVNTEIDSVRRKRDAETALLLNLAPLTERNAVENLARLSDAISVRTLAEAAHNDPAIIIASGPSLNDAIPMLKGLEEKAILISALKSLRLLTQEEIVPHFAVNIDPHPEMKKCVEGITPNRNTTYFYSTDSCPDISALFSHSATFESVSNISEWASETLGGWGKMETGLSVAHQCFYLARHLGCNPIILVGVDLCFPRANTHAEGVTITQSWTPKADDPGASFVLANNGEKVLTSEGFRVMITAFESAFAHSPELSIYNTSAIGAKMRGTIYTPISLLREELAHQTSHNFIMPSQIASRWSAMHAEIVRVLNTAPRILGVCMQGEAACDRALYLIERGQMDRISTSIAQIQRSAAEVEGAVLKRLCTRLMTRDALKIKQLSREITATPDKMQTLRLQITRAQIFFHSLAAAIDVLRGMFSDVGY